MALRKLALQLAYSAWGTIVTTATTTASSSASIGYFTAITESQ